MPLPAELDRGRGKVKTAITAALKRFSKGMLKTVALATPENPAACGQLGRPGPDNTFQLLQRFLEEEQPGCCRWT